MNALQTLKIVFSLVPALIEAIKAIEAAVPGQGQGEAKLAAVRQIMEGIYDQAEALWPMISTAITALVALFNQTGAFGGEKS